MKLLRAEGLDVQVTGEPSHELNFLSTKGIHEWLSDPLILTLVGVPVSIVCGVLSNVLTDLLAKRKPKIEVVSEINDGGSRFSYRSDGTPIEGQHFDTMLRAIQERRRSHSSGVPRLNGAGGPIAVPRKADTAFP